MRCNHSQPPSQFKTLTGPQECSDLGLHRALEEAHAGVAGEQMSEQLTELIELFSGLVQSMRGKCECTLHLLL
jgi:hypothetical protein